MVKVLARRTLNGEFPSVLRTEDESKVAAIVAYTPPGEAKAILYTLDKGFQDVAKLTPVTGSFGSLPLRLERRSLLVGVGKAGDRCNISCL